MNFYLWGGCELEDTVPHLQKRMPLSKFTYVGGTSCGSLFSNAGPVTEAVYNWYEQLTTTEPERSKRVQSAKNLYQEVVTKDYFPDWMRKEITKDDWLILSFSKEIYPRYNSPEEHITLGDDMVQAFGTATKLKFPKKIVSKVFDKTHHVGFDDEYVIHTYKNEWGPMLAEYFYDIFQDRVLLVHNEPARRYYHPSIGVYWDLPTINSMSQIYLNSGAGKYHNKDNWYEVSKTVKFLHTGFRLRYPTKIPQITLSHKETVGDDHHKFGRNVFHYTRDTHKLIARRIISKLSTIIAKKAGTNIS